MKVYDWVAILFAVIFLLSGIFTQAEYGISWDEGLGSLFFGERYLLFFSSFNEIYLDFKAELPYHNENDLALFKSPFRDLYTEFPPVSDTFSAAIMYLTSNLTGWLDPVDGWHLFTILLASVFLVVFYFFVAKRLGRITGLFSMFLLGVFPRFWGDMHFNPKDVPETIFYSLVLMSYSDWYDDRSRFKAIRTGVVFALALGTKLNAIFIPLVIFFGIWPISGISKTIRDGINHLKTNISDYLLMGGSFLIVYIFSWPIFWKNPLNISLYFKYMFSQGGRGFSGTPGDAFMQVIYTMPVLMLILMVVGIISTFSERAHEMDKWKRFFLVWLLVPLIRSNLPGISNFDGIRHFLEFLPAASIFAAYGIYASIEFISERVKINKPILIIGWFTILIVNYSILHMKFHPFQHIYYNRLIGGLQGAEEYFGPNEATDYWAVSYRSGLDWINENAPAESGVYVPIAPWLVEVPFDLWAREDIIYVSGENFDHLRNEIDDMFVMFITRPAFYNEIANHSVQNLVPVYTIEVDGVNVLVIYQY